MKFLRFIIFLYLLSNISSLFTKYGSEVLKTNYAIFEAKEFKDDEEMHFKIKSHSYNFKQRNKNLYDVEYNYNSNANDNMKSFFYPYHEIIKKTSTEGKFETKYFTIKKTWSEYTSSNGNYMYIKFPNLHVSRLETATITNT